MMNGYIVDTFLAFCAFLTLSLLIIDNASLVGQLNKRVDSHTFIHYFNKEAKLSLLLSGLPIIFYVFSLWRFAELLIFAKMWGAGAIGLAIMMGLAGVGFIWLKILIHLILRNTRQPSTTQKGEMV